MPLKPFDVTFPASLRWNNNGNFVPARTTMKNISDKDRLATALRIVKDIHRNPGVYAEKYPSGTSFTAIGTVDDVLTVHVQLPSGDSTIVKIPTT